jgi:hypothetical protein
MKASIQQAEQKWHDELFASRRKLDLVVPLTSHYFCFLARLDRLILDRPLEGAPAWQRMIVDFIHRIDSAIPGLPFLNRLAGVAVLELSPLQQ